MLVQQSPKYNTFETIPEKNSGWNYSKYLNRETNSLFKGKPSFSEDNIVLRHDELGFAKFHSYALFRDELSRFNQENRLFHEIVLENVPRKLLFDVDLSINVEKDSVFKTVSDFIDKFISNIEKNKINNNIEFIRKVINFTDRIIENISDSVEAEYLNNSSHYYDEDLSQPYVTVSHGFVLSNGKEISLYDISTNDYVDSKSTINKECLLPEFNEQKIVKFKFSIHVIFNYITANSQENKLLAHNVIDRMEPNIRDIVDKGVYKSNQSIRMLNCNKLNSGRIKIKYDGVHNKYSPIYTDYVLTTIDFDESIIHPLSRINGLKSHEIYVPSLIQSSTPVKRTFSGNDLSKEMIELVEKSTEGMRYIGGGRLKRFTRGHCKICKREHDNDNGFVVNNTHGLFIGCFRNEDKNNKLIKLVSYEDSEPNINNNQSIVDELLSYTDSATGFATGPPAVISNNNSATITSDVKEYTEYINKKYIDVSDYEENLKNNDILMIKSGTGSGKSYALRKYLQNLINEDKDIRILMISYRQSLANEFYNKYSDIGFKHYKKDYPNYKEIGINNVKLLIIQVESLYKLQTKEFQMYDMVILDEINKITEQINSGLTKNPYANKNILYSLFKSKKLIGMDAFLNNNAIRLVSQYRNNIKNRNADVADFYAASDNSNNSASDNSNNNNSAPFKLLINTFQHKVGRKYYNISNKHTLIEKAIESAKNKRIFICCNSRKLSEELYELFCSIYNTKKIKLYNGTSNKKNKSELSDINKHWKVDVLIYTSVIEAGNSFDEEWFDEGFMYFTNRSTNHLGCLQMLDRIRNIKLNTCYFYINNCSFKSYSFEQVEQKMKVAKYAAFNGILDSGIIYSHDYNNQLNYIDKNEHYYCFIRNIVYNEWSKANFKRLLIECWKSTGIEIESLADINDNPTNPSKDSSINDNPRINVRKLQSDVKKSLNDKLTKAIIESDIIPRFGDSETLDEPTKIKLNLMRTYDVNESQITEVFIKRYNKPELLKGYKNRKRIIECESIKNYKQSLLNKFNSISDDYTPIEKIYDKSKYINKFHSLDILNIMTNNGIFNLIKNPKEPITITKDEFIKRVNNVVNLVKKFDNSYKLKGKLLAAKESYRLRVINQIINETLDIKITRVKTTNSPKYIISVIGLIK